MDPGLRGLLRSRSWLLIWLPVMGIAILHYATPMSLDWVHGVARRLYYLPIVGAAFAGGRLGGLVAAAVILVIYTPHAWLLPHAMDPGGTAEKALEMALYVVVGGVSGALVERERREQRRQAKLAADLARSLEETRAIEAQLIRAGRLGALGQLTAGLAHEIRNPLHAMRGTAEILADAAPEGSGERGMGAALLQEIDRLSALLKRFLDFARPAPPEAMPTPLQDIVDRVAGLVSAQAGRQGVSVETPAGEDVVAAADPEQIVQVVLGIALNALQSAPAGGRVSLSVVRRASAAGTFGGVRVFNDGPHVPEDMLETIFDPFVTTREDGTGLGLAVAWRIMDAHRGFVEVENLPGGGVVFSAFLPLQSAPTQS